MDIISIESIGSHLRTNKLWRALDTYNKIVANLNNNEDVDEELKLDLDDDINDITSNLNIPSYEYDGVMWTRKRVLALLTSLKGRILPPRQGGKKRTRRNKSKRGGKRRRRSKRGGTKRRRKH